MSRVHFPVTALGPGRRLGVWVQGCPLACAGCMSRDTWDASGGRDTDLAELADCWRAAVADGADGLTVSGGEPLAQPAVLGDLLDVVDEVRGQTGRELDVLLYTGFEPSELDDAQLAVLARADAVVTGRYRADQPTNLVWRGSANQLLTPQTDLGARRYGPHVNRVPDRAPMQVRVDAGDVWFIGVPPAGALPRLERMLRDQGVRFGKVAWRP